MPAEAVAAIRIADTYLEHLEAGGTSTPEDFLASRGHDSEEALELLRLVAAFETECRRRPAVGGRLGPYRIEGMLGRGGMGVVYRAVDTRLDREVALKVNLHGPLDRVRQERFLREARAAAQIHHTNLVPVHELGSEEGIWFYAMERVEGRPLDDVIRDLNTLGQPPGAEHLVRLESPWTAEGKSVYEHRIADLFVGVAEALHRAHLGGVLHRDVKPANLILSNDGALLLTDFGLARLQEETAALTGTGQRVGTPAYMSPEQVRGGAAPADARSDVYSLGATLYEALTLRRPFESSTTEAIYHQVLTAEPASVRTLNPGIPRDLSTIVHKAMDKEPARRYETAAALAADLRAFGNGLPIRARPVGRVHLTWRKVKRNRPLAATIGTAVVLGVLGAVWSMVSLNAARLEAERGWRAAEESRASADQRREVAEDAIIWMLFDLGERIQDIGRPDIVLEMAEQADALYEKLSLSGRRRTVMQSRSRILRLKGEVLQEQGRPEEALEAYVAGVKLLEMMLENATDPPDPEWQPAIELQWLEANLQVVGVMKDAEEALVIAKKLRARAEAWTEREPEDLDWLIALGYAQRAIAVCHLRAGNRKEGFEAVQCCDSTWQRVRTQEPDRAAWPLERAYLAQFRAITHFDAGEHGAALTAWRASVVHARRALVLEPENFRVKKGLGDVLRQLGWELFRHRSNLDEADALLQEAVELLRSVFERDTTQGQAGEWLISAAGRLGQVRREEGDDEGAMKAWRFGLEVAETLDWGVDTKHYEIAEVLIELGHLDEAREHLEAGEAFKRMCNQREGKHDDHGLERAWCGLGCFHERRGEHPQARALFAAALRLVPGNPSALEGLGRTLLSLGERAEGLALLRQAFDERERRYAEWPADPRPWIELADVTLDLGTALLEGSEGEPTEGEALLRGGVASPTRASERSLTPRQRKRIPRFGRHLRDRAAR